MRCCFSHPQAAKLLKASILKVDVADLEMDEDELAEAMAQQQQGRAELDEMLAQHNVPQQQQQDGGDAEMHEAAGEQQENVPPAEGGDANVQQQQQSQQQGKQQQEQGKQQSQQQQETQQQRRTTSISAEKYEFIKVGTQLHIVCGQASCCCKARVCYHCCFIVIPSMPRSACQAA